MRPRVLLLAALMVGGLLTFLIVVWLAVGTVLLILGLALTDKADAAARHGVVVRSPHWAPPVAGAPTRLFDVTADPFARGQHRGVDLAAGGEPVRAACAGRVVFAGRVAGEGTVSQRCGRWRVSYAPLTRISVRAGAAAGPGTRLGRARGALHFGVRREGRRFGYVDPLRFLAARRSPPPPVVAPPRESRPRASPRPAPHPAHAPPALAPWPVWLGLALLLAGVVGVGRLRLPALRRPGPATRAPAADGGRPTSSS